MATTAIRIVVLGGGPAGYLGALRAAQLGASVTLVEKAHCGGVCLNQGCIPTKALLRTSELADYAKKCGDFGLDMPLSGLDWSRSLARKERITKILRNGVEQLLKEAGVTRLTGEGRLSSAKEMEVVTETESHLLCFDKLLIATGSKAKRPPIPGADALSVVTSDKLLTLKKIPRRLVVIGGGVIGLEFAQMFLSLGSEVLLLELQPQLLPEEDKDIVLELVKSMQRQGLRIFTQAQVTNIAYNSEETTVSFTHKGAAKDVPADVVLLATGRQPSSPPEAASLGLALGDQGEIIVNKRQETNLPGIYAAGDVTGGKLLAHKAYAEGRAAMENALGYPAVVPQHLVPSCVYTQPELASVGLTEEAAIRQGYEVRCGRASFRQNGRALCLGERDGLVKVVVDAVTDRLLGIHMTGPHVSELLGEASLALSLGVTALQLSTLTHPHPSLSEALMEACAQATE